MLYQLSYLGARPCNQVTGERRVIEARSRRVQQGRTLLRGFTDTLFPAIFAGGRRAVLVVVLNGRNGINPGHPAVQINVGAAPRAERLECLDLRFAADGARFLGSG